NRWVIIIFIIFLLAACKNGNEKITRIVFKIQSAQGRKILLQKVPFNDEPIETVDSATVVNGEDSIIFFVQRKEERPFKIRVVNTDKDFLFINDAPTVRISGNLISNRFTIEGSPTSTALKNFFTE